MKWLSSSRSCSRRAPRRTTQSQVEITDRDCIGLSRGQSHPSRGCVPDHDDGPKHSGIDCADCHIFSKGPGLNMVHAECTACHFQADIDPTHIPRTDGYMWDPVESRLLPELSPDGLPVNVVV